jgi:predicted neutral ceramidase superfamily lipid hydrolase
MSSSLLKKIPLFWKVWLLHVVTYYPILGLYAFNKFNNIFEAPLRKSISAILFSPLVGIVGLFEDFPFYVVIQIVLMSIINLIIKKMFYSYVITIVLSNLSLFEFVHGVSYFDKENYIDPMSLIVAILLNRIILKKSYQLNERNDGIYDN